MTAYTPNYCGNHKTIRLCVDIQFQVVCMAVILHLNRLQTRCLTVKSRIQFSTSADFYLVPYFPGELLVNPYKLNNGFVCICRLRCSSYRHYSQFTPCCNSRLWLGPREQTGSLSPLFLWIKFGLTFRRFGQFKDFSCKFSNRKIVVIYVITFDLENGTSNVHKNCIQV